tara:strand:- start:356 stop:538 length:183 start_codon:yes stop_codon:yes gene_type:complete
LLERDRNSYGTRLAAEIEELFTEDIETESADLEGLMIGKKVKALTQDLAADHTFLGYLLD